MFSYYIIWHLFCIASIFVITHENRVNLAPPQIDGSKNDAQPRVIIGGSHTLWCIASGHPHPTISWLKDGMELSNMDEYTLNDDGTILAVRVAESKHAGRYTCTARNDAGEAELDIALDVWVPPTVSISSEETIRPLQAPIILLCQADGNPEPQLSWSKNGQQLLTSPSGARISRDGGRLDIPRLRRDDIGEYTCTARSDAGLAEASVMVDVLVPPTIMRDGVDMSPKIQSGQTLTLSCEAEGKPEPELKWFFGDVNVTSDGERIDLAPTGRYMQISDIQLDNKGYYKCTAENTAGRDEIIYDVQVVQPPAISGGGTIQVIEGETAEIDCTSAGTPLPEIVWQRNGQRINTDDKYVIEGRTVRVLEARSRDAGIYVCVATNDIGSAQQAYTLEILVPPKITDTSQDNTIVPVNASFTLRCGARGYPPPEISWFRDDTPVDDDTPDHSIDPAGTLMVTRAAAAAEPVEFICTATNAAGQDEKSYTVQIIKPPSITKDGLRVMNISQGEPSVFVCEVDQPIPTITWYEGDSSLDMHRNPTLELNKDKTSLKFGDTRLTDAGDYRCVAENPAGNATQRFRLNVGVPPRITEEPRRLIATNGSRADLPCEAVGVPIPMISWLIDNEEVNDELRSGDSLVFSRTRPDDAMVYTCKAENWAGTAYKDLELIVFVKPEVIPENSEHMVKEKGQIVMHCNVTGIPEPVVTWYKDPDDEIISGQKYNILGTALALRNAHVSDDGYYRCVAKSSAGTAIGYRKLTVDLPERPWKIIWVECDDQGRPVRTTYKPARGDVADDDQTLLPWKTELQDLPENGTQGMLIRCLPDRPQAPSGQAKPEPTITEVPRDTQLPEDGTLELACAASGTPLPTITWERDGEEIEKPEFAIQGRSTLRIVGVKQAQTGTYTCVASNEHGTARATAAVNVYAGGGDDPRSVSNPERTYVTREVAILSCKGLPPGRRGTWLRDGVAVHNSERAHLMKNGSLIVFEPFDEEELAKYKCVDSNRQTGVAFSHQQVDDRDLRVRVWPKRLIANLNAPAYLHCQTSHPLTADVSWLVNNAAITSQNGVHIHDNNTLEIRYVQPSDRGVYRCVASSQSGQLAYDDASLLTNDVPRGVSGYMTGKVNGVPMSAQRLIANVTPMINSNDIYVRLEALPVELSPAGRSTLGFAGAPCWVLAYPGNGQNGYQLSNGQFVQNSNYQFMSGEQLNIRQSGTGVDRNGYLVMDILVDGKVPHLPGQSSVYIDPSTSRFTQLSPGFLRGAGSSTMRVGQHFVVPFRWHHNISYTPNQNVELESSSQDMVVETIGSGGSAQGQSPHEMTLRASMQPGMTCPPGYTVKNGANSCDDVNECEEDTEICRPGQQCLNTIGSYRCIGSCPPGFAIWANNTCEDLDECSLGISACGNGKACVNSVGSYSCAAACQTGFRRSASGDCEDIDECLTEIPCHPDQRCINTPGSFRCFCPAGFVAKSPNSPCEDLNECSLTPYPCSHGCNNVPGSYNCYCPPGMSLTRDRRTCTLAHGLNQHISSEFHKTGGNQFGGSNPICPGGMTWNGVMCTATTPELNDCAVLRCQYQCDRTNGNFACLCPQGYQLGADRRSCEDINECLNGNTCTEDTICFNEKGSYSCISNPCPRGYTLEHETRSCQIACDAGDSECQSSGAPVVRIQMLALPLGVGAHRDLLRLSAYDSADQALQHTRFHMRHRHNDLPFGIRQHDGRGVVFTRRPLNRPRQYRVPIRATSFEQQPSPVKYQTDFIVFISVSQYPF